MSRKAFCLACAAICSGFVGGMLPQVLNGLPAVAQEGSKSIAANEFRLLDQKGRLRAVLGMGQDGDRPTLVFYDKDGGQQINLYTSGNHQSLGFLNRRGELSVLLSSGPNSPSLFMASEQGANIILKNEFFKQYVTMGSTSSGPSIHLLDETNDKHTELSLDWLNIVGKDQKYKATLGLFNGDPILSIDNDSKRLVQLGFTTGFGTRLLLSQINNDRPIWVAP